MRCALLLDLYELTMGQSYFIYQKDNFATFDLFVRALPPDRAYLVAAGLEDILNFAKNLRFNREDLLYLKKQKIFSSDFLKYLSGFSFSGDIWAMPEGEVFFANEPLLRVTAPIIEAQLLESFFLNTINLQSMIASKAARVVTAAQGKKVFDFSLRRTHGAEAGLKVARSCFIAGVNGTSCVLAGKIYNIPVAGTMAHSFVMAFKNEIDSFLAYAETFPDKSILLVDTYDTAKGIENAVTIGLYLKEKGHHLQGVRIDSGDMAYLAHLARKRLDQAGLNYVKVFATGNLDEFKIKRLLEQGAPIDSFGVGTNMGTSFDAPCLDVIYKLSEVADEQGGFLPTMKLSKGKVTYPGRKQVFRLEDKNGRFLKDVVGLETEKIQGRPLLKKIIAKGKRVYRAPSLEKIRSYACKNLLLLPKGILRITNHNKYQVTVSRELEKLRLRLRRQLVNRQ